MMEKYLNKITHADCMDVLKELPDKCIDSIICDLPYEMTACEWDTIIPFDELWAQYKRVRKDTSPIILFASQPFTSKLVLSNSCEYRESLVWLKNKPASGFRHNQAHLKIHEDIIVFSKTPNYTFNPQKWLISEKEFITQRKTFKENEYIGNNIYGSTTRTRKADTGERNPISILSCRVPFTPSNNKTYSTDVDIRIHPTQKPIALLEYLVKTYSNEDSVILDNCSGSGTTAIACKQLGRNFICVEKDLEYYNKSVERLNNTVYRRRLI